MEPFTFIRKNEATAAVEQVSGDEHARFLAGGTTLIDLMKLNVETPTQVVAVNHLPLSKIEATSGGGLRIGAMVNNTDLAYHEAVRTR